MKQDLIVGYNLNEDIKIPFDTLIGVIKSRFGISEFTSFQFTKLIKVYFSERKFTTNSPKVLEKLEYAGYLVKRFENNNNPIAKHRIYYKVNPDMEEFIK